MKAIITHIDKAKGYILSEYNIYLDREPGLFLRFSREFGRCVSKVYVGDSKPVGWVFEKASGPNYFRSYVVETWVTLVPGE